MRPVIGVLGNILIMEGGILPGIERAYVNYDYIDAIIKVGGVPYIVPMNLEEEIIAKQISLLDGLILSGGFDVNPLLYGEQPSKHQDYTYPEIDEFYLKSINFALDKNIPILGICKGMQMLNVALGGSLYQDISQVEGSYIKHVQSAKRSTPTHSVSFNKGSKLYEIFGEKTFINSYHHQCVKKLGQGLMAVAFSDDNIVEAIELEGKDFVVGVQWHPEMMVQNPKSNMIKLFEEFIKFAGRE
ncbi:MAG: putative gamma-glutamyl-gamma-aminobutyratehydrolase [Caloramator sp.]|jgi:putative glutamine amidotransferase|uniref:gamma-glutamyl-gamma-aminobutyrate hydrolase family protein n=1 Tax=Caloramator sp. TaxID=1871330 RepID=UPI001DFE8F84|nr:gamma-glutamyl-gamma-aminobutyrate hydrolase family protein [Caloramator sp.]MBZ4663722.1 putative gamma-glutamyl-gamma-aminobutyratehydrolase [Caloramator sp.]